MSSDKAKQCKFCGIFEGVPDRNGKAAHINRDNLCAPCYYVLERIKYQPEVLDAEAHAWFNEMCEFNMKHGMFVPVAQRRALSHLRPWQCKCCSSKNILARDTSYINYCTQCAGNIRRSREMPKTRKTRKDCQKNKM